MWCSVLLSYASTVSLASGHGVFFTVSSMVDGELVLILAHFHVDSQQGVGASADLHHLHREKALQGLLGFLFFIYITTGEEFHGGLLGEGSLLHSACDILLPLYPQLSK